MSAHEAWALVCRIFASGTPVLRRALAPREQMAVATLGLALKPAALDMRHALCPYCQQQRGQVWADGRGGRVCHCPECGPVALDADDVAAVSLDEAWLRRGLRLALAIDSRDGIDALADRVWRLGDTRRAPAVLARDMDRLWRDPTLLDRVRVAGGAIRVITPRPSRDLHGDPFGPGVEWWPLEERFTLYAGGITHIAPLDTQDQLQPADPAAPVHGPFSADFRWIHLPDWPHGVVHCSKGQAAVFEALWSFHGEPRNGAAVMARAGLSSDKPTDLFKVKARDKGDPRYEGPLFAYHKLVQTQQRAGLYALPCARAAT